MSRKTANERDFFNSLAKVGGCFDKLKADNARLEAEIRELQEQLKEAQKPLVVDDGKNVTAVVGELSGDATFLKIGK